jgi:hypothetical protein
LATSPRSPSTAAHPAVAALAARAGASQFAAFNDRTVDGPYRYQDHLDSKGITTSKALVLEGGWKAWRAAFGEDAELTSGAK